MRVRAAPGITAVIVLFIAQKRGVMRKVLAVRRGVEIPIASKIALEHAPIFPRRLGGSPYFISVRRSDMVCASTDSPHENRNHLRNRVQLYGIFFLVCLAVAAYRAAKGQPSPFETEED